MLFRDNHRATAGKFHTPGRLLFTAVVAAALCGTAAAGETRPEDERCLTCHSMSGLSKSLQSGEKLSLQVARQAYTDSVHSPAGCRTCHRDVDPGAHPSGKTVATARAYSIAQSENCRACHSAKFEQYEGSIHASLVAAGNAEAPVCSSCHDPHAVRQMATFAPLAGEPCKNCHEDIFNAYTGSVHGRARIESGHMKAPACGDCHQVHEIQAVKATERLKAACIGCHEAAPVAHADWLPNSVLHLDVIACPACHSPRAERIVDLRLYDDATGQLLAEVAGDPRFEAQARKLDTEGNGLDPMELWTLIRDADGQGMTTGVSLRGRLEVRTGVEAHQLAAKPEAARNCDSCHISGTATFNNVTISILAADGRKVRYPANGDVLTSAVSVGSVGGFYTAGGTRIGIFDGLLLLAMFAGVGIPVTHMTARKLFRKKD